MKDISALIISVLRRSSFVITVLSCSLLLSLAAGCRHAPADSAEADEPKIKGEMLLLDTNSPQMAMVRVEPVGATDQTHVSLAGRLVWDEDATVRVFTPFAGIVRKIFPALNAPVGKETPLAEIQSADFAQAQSDARKAESDFRRAERNLRRLRDLFEHGAAPRKDVESAEADYAGAEAEQDRTQARLATYGATALTVTNGFLLPSPLEGILVEKNVTPGQEVRPDQMLANMPQLSAPLFVVSDPTRLWIQIEATEIDLPRLQPGREFTFTSRAFPDRGFTGRVETVSEFIDPTTRTIKVRGTVNNPQRLLKAEMFVTVNVPSDRSASPSVPAQAVFLNGEKHYVLVEEEPGRFARRQIQVGAQENEHVMVLSGLEPGQRVVTQGSLLLQQLYK
jgi:cobalt-zinc-cadmium efflux system membrane fusion protein